MKFVFKIIGFIICIVLSTSTIAQNQNSVWYFGQSAGISFTNNIITTLTDGEFSHTEGVSSICDTNGDLKFFTNGLKIWNVNREVMPNGSGLLGNNSSAQILILPNPTDCNLYYIFTTPPQGADGAAYYSIVDMRRDFGKGDIITKNVLLAEFTTERISATFKANGTDYWVLLQAFGDNGFLAYSLSTNGVDANPVASFSGLGNATVEDAVGCMKFSTNGNKLATANELGNKKCQLFDFNTITGVVSNGFVINDSAAYGVEFSDDDSKLYLCRYTGFRLTQYDLSSNNPTIIKNSQIVLATVPTPTSINGGALQIGPDKRIYIARDNQTFLDAIVNPNILGIACGYQPNAINLLGKKCYAGLPNFAKNFPPLYCGSLKASFTQANACGGNNTTITIIADFGTAPLQYSINSQNFQVSNIFSNVAAQDYVVTVKDAIGEIRNLNLKIPFANNFTLSATILKKPDCGIANGSIKINTTNGAPPFLFSKDGINYQSDSIFTALNATTFNFVVKDLNSCETTTQIVLNNENLNKIFVGNDTGIFINQTIPLVAIDKTNSNFISYKWAPVIGLNNAFIQNPIATITNNITYSLEATTAAGCIARDTIFLEVYKKIGLFVPSAFTPNGDGKNEILKAIPRGIKQINYFKIFSRYGVLIFNTNTLNTGWDGRWNGIPQNTGTYVWIAEGKDIEGNILTQNGTFTLLR